MKRYSQGVFQRYVLLNMIHAFGPISRTQLASLSGFRPATVGELAKALIDEGLVVETGFAAVGAGRRRVMLDMNRRGISAVGVAIAREKVTTVLARLDGTIVRDESCLREPDCPREALVGRIADMVGVLLGDAERIRAVRQTVFFSCL